jgi:hypothetical protein
LFKRSAFKAFTLHFNEIRPFLPHYPLLVQQTNAGQTASSFNKSPLITPAVIRLSSGCSKLASVA